MKCQTGPAVNPTSSEAAGILPATSRRQGVEMRKLINRYKLRLIGLLAIAMPLVLQACQNGGGGGGGY